MSMRAPSWRLRVGFAIVAGCLLGACQTIDRRNFDEAGARYLAVPRSPLVERQDLQFALAGEERGGVTVAVLAYTAPGSNPWPVSVVTSSGSGTDKQVSVQRYPLSKPWHEGGDVDVAALEYLYTLVLRHDPDAQFCFADIGQRCNAAGNARSHAGVLLQLTRARGHAVRTAKDPGSFVPWHIVTLALAATPDATPDDVSVRITGERRPMKGITIFFNRARHSSCQAKSGEDGVASCRLVDQHGDDDSHADQDRTPVLAIFPGDIGADSVLLPTTLIVRPPS